MKLKLLKIQPEAGNAKSFFFETEKPLDFVAGQFLYVTLPKLDFPDSKGATRHFTVSSSPTEGNIIRVTTKIREESGYKKTLEALTEGAVLEGEGPEGTFTIDDNEKGEHVFIAGGIGITPFRSILKYVTDKNLSIPIHLIYSSSTAEEIVFKKELEDLDTKYPNIKIDFVVTSQAGHLDENMIKSLVSPQTLLTSTYWLCGPPLMVDAIEDVLQKLEILAGKVRIEKFTGY